MGRIQQAFERAQQEQRAALVIYLCAGDPDLATTVRLVCAAADAGADVIELGMPFSDPTADGPTIQKASERALAKGTTMRGAIDVVREVRKTHQVPVLLFGYYNPVLSYGEVKLANDAADAGADGFLVVDLPPEEAGPLRDAAVARGMDLVPLIAPTSHEERVRLAADTATSFIYYVSMTGVTGAVGIDLQAASARAGRAGEADRQAHRAGLRCQHARRRARGGCARGRRGGGQRGGARHRVGGVSRRGRDCRHRAGVLARRRDIAPLICRRSLRASFVSTTKRPRNIGRTESLSTNGERPMERL
jgi:tryptophan synthase alpha chain